MIETREVKRVDPITGKKVSVPNMTAFKRQIKGMGRAANDAESLAQLVELQQHLADVITETAQRLNDEGFSWTELAAPLGVTRQGARQKYARKTSA